MKLKKYHPAFILLHWVFAIVLFTSAAISKQKEMSGLPLNLHAILGGVLLILLFTRLLFRFRKLTHIRLDQPASFFYPSLYLLLSVMLGMGGWVAYRRNLLGYLIDPNTAIGRGGFKTLANIHKLTWQFALGWIALHLGGVLYSQFILKKPVLARMWF